MTNTTSDFREKLVVNVRAHVRRNKDKTNFVAPHFRSVKEIEQEVDKLRKRYANLLSEEER